MNSATSLDKCFLTTQLYFVNYLLGKNVPEECAHLNRVASEIGSNFLDCWLCTMLVIFHYWGSIV